MFLEMIVFGLVTFKFDIFTQNFCFMVSSFFGTPCSGL
jgi:hypothetical protein